MVIIKLEPQVNAIAADPFPTGDWLGWNWGLGGSSGTSGSGPGGSSGSSGGGAATFGGKRGSGRPIDYTEEEWAQAQRQYARDIEEYNIMQARKRLQEAIATNPVVQSIAKLESFLFIDLPLTVSGAGVYSVAGRVGGSLLGQSLGRYLQGAILRGGTDAYLQQNIKGNIDIKQTGINTLLGGGTGSFATNMGVANLVANTANNIYNSLNHGTFTKDREVNSVKIITGAFGMAFGNLYSNYAGNILLPSVYGNTLDYYLDTK